MSSPDLASLSRHSSRAAELAGHATFEHSAALAADLFGVPMALVTRADPDRQRVLATVGFEEQQAEQASPFCAYAARAQGATMIEDVTSDDRFAQHPLVTGPPGVRFYAGVSLTDADGQPLGALIVLGPTPRVPTGANLRQLKRLGAMASEALILRREAAAQEETEEALREREAQLRGLANSIPGVIVQFYVQPNGAYGYHFVSERAEELLGLSSDPEGFFGRIVEHLPDSHRDDFLEAVEAAVEREGPFRFETPFVKPSGERLWLLGTAVPERRGGELVYNGVILDITERKEAERKLEKSEQRYRTLAEHFPNGAVGVYDHDLRYTLAAGAKLGDTLPAASRLEGDRMPDIFPEGTAADLEPLFRAAVEEGATGSVETAFNDRDWKVWATPLRDADGKIFAGLSFAQDITERKQREGELERTMHLLTLAEEMAGVGGWSVDVSEAPQYSSVWTDKLHDIFGVPVDKDLPIEKAIEYYHPEDQSRHRRAVDRTLETGEGWDQELRVVTPEGEERWVHNVGEPVCEDGEVVKVHGMIQDITERKHREQELRAAKEEAEEASRLKSAMLANMSHEIRTPLTSITGFSEVLAENLEGDLKEFAEKAYTSSQRLMKTLDSVLQLSKLEAGVHTLEREPVRLGAIIEDTVEMLRPTAEEEAVALGMQCPEGPIEGDWNEGALNRIVGNLVENAIKFTPSGGQVEVRGAVADGTAVLEVEDTGVGISDEFQDVVFDAFRQESVGVRREYEGSGLGLSIVERLVEVLDGTIALESEKGEGTCFTVRLPLAEGSDQVG